MRFISERIDRLKIGWNKRTLTERDLYRLCRRFRIHVEEMPLRTDGFYYRVIGRDFIAVDSKLPELKKLAVLFHELGHYLFHTPDTGATANFHGVGRRTRKECEADVFALCALIPRPVIETKSVDELIDEGFTSEMVAARLSVLERHGF
ncbi:MAG: ImmA/IrrE family metallo-endopeptidase [Acidobacteria bacterium]|nr:ImmA/IrrE family metallo-endopeptidase [Acidobacteriota bacterium]